MKVEYGFDEVEIIKVSGDSTLCEEAKLVENEIFNYSIRHSLDFPVIKQKEVVKIKSDSNLVLKIESVIPKPKKDKKPEKIVLNNLLFEFNDTILKPISLKALSNVIDILTSKPNLKAKIIGFTDSQGSATYNMKLSQRRAYAVRDYLISKNISPSRLIANGKGETLPITSNENEEGRKKNRRVEVEFFY